MHPSPSQRKAFSSAKRKRQQRRAIISTRTTKDTNSGPCHNLVVTSLTVLALCSSLLTLLLLPTILRLDKSTENAVRQRITRQNIALGSDTLSAGTAGISDAIAMHDVDDSRPCFHARQSSSTSYTNYSLPILNLGFPKGGSTNLQHYFQCGGFDTSHYKCRKKMPRLGPGWHDKGVKCGKCLRFALHKDVPEPLLEHCGNYQVYTQLDVENDWIKGGCYFPQIQTLDILHDENPNATFVLTFRPVNKWIDSMSHWKGFDRPMIERLGACHNSIPGLEGTTSQHFADWWCDHVENVRSFVKAHPSHKLVEVEIENDGAGAYMAKYFGIDEKCWHHTNKNILKDVADEELRDMAVEEDLPKWMQKDIQKKKWEKQMRANQQQ